MSPCAQEVVSNTVGLVLIGTALALAVIGCYACLVRYAYWREHNHRRKAWHDREKG
jgi:hypothetical protein